MNITNAKWSNADQTTILATIGGIEVTVPNVMGNRERQALAEWEATGQVILPYVAPPAPPRTTAGAYFRAALKDMGHYDAVIAAVTDPINLELFNTATEFSEADADVNAIATALSIDLGAVFDAADAIRAARQA